jgi:hypothetical protein
MYASFPIKINSLDDSPFDKAAAPFFLPLAPAGESGKCLASARI